MWKVSGGREGNVKVWDTRIAKKPVVSVASSSKRYHQDSEVSSRKSRYHQDKKQVQVNMEPESSKRECWAVSAGNSYEQEERMVSSIIIAATITVLAIIITTIIVIICGQLMR